MPRQRRAGSVDMTELINFIKAYVKQQQRENPRYSYAALARQSKIAGSTLSELMSRPDREPSGHTLARLAIGMEVDPPTLYRIAYPRSDDETLRGGRQQNTVRLSKRVVTLLKNDPQYYGRLVELAERISPERRARVMAYAEGLAEASDDLSREP